MAKFKVSDQVQMKHDPNHGLLIVYAVNDDGTYSICFNSSEELHTHIPEHWLEPYIAPMPRLEIGMLVEYDDGTMRHIHALTPYLDENAIVKIYSTKLVWELP